MADTADPSAEQNTPKAPKDRNCPYCGQAFTSSSLGRHLDLYIREKNPKPPDGVHDVDEIRKVRGAVTRRQPRPSLTRQDTSTPAATPTTASRRSPDSGSGLSPALTRDESVSARPTKAKYPFIHGFEATGVINNITSRDGEGGRGTADIDGALVATPDSGKRTALPQRAANRQALKGQLNEKHKVQDALDTARAAELALREIISSIRAAKQEINMNSTPFDFDPLALDFPALCLQCLQAPPTLFSSTQHPTPTSWSITTPSKRQYEALQAFFLEEFKKWKIACSAVTTAVHEELTYPPSETAYRADVRETVRKAQKIAEGLERQVTEHIQSAYSVWTALPTQRRDELWVLELARSAGRKQRELDKLRDAEHALKQENANLRMQIEHLNRLQQPREFKIMTPATIPFDGKLVHWFLEEGMIHGRKNVGMTMDDRHLDLNTIVSSAIDRWKSVIVTARSGSGMSQQRPLDESAPSTAGLDGPASATATFAPTHSVAGSATSTTGGSSVSTPVAQAPTPQAPPRKAPALQNPRHGKGADSAHGTGKAAAFSTTSAAGTAPANHRGESASTSSAATPSAHLSSSANENSDLDADAEMEDDDYQEMSTAPASATVPQLAPPVTLQAAAASATPQLDVPRIRPGHARRGGSKSPRAGGGAGGGLRSTRSVSHISGGRGARGGGGKAAAASRAVTNIGGDLRAAAMAHADMGIVGGGGGGEPMFTD